MDAQMEAIVDSEITDYSQDNLYSVKIDFRNVSIWQPNMYRYHVMTTAFQFCTFSSTRNDSVNLHITYKNELRNFIPETLCYIRKNSK
jgi:hypothetical protein